jgi:hypothetical protein
MPIRDRDGSWVRDVTIRDAYGARWTADAWVVIRAGRLVVGEVRVFPLGSGSAKPGDPWKGSGRDVPRHGLERRLLRDVPVGRYAPVAEAWVSQMAQQPDFAPDAVPRVDLSVLNLVLPGASTLAPRPRPRRNVGRDDLFYAGLAQEYVDRLADRSIHPVQDIARRRGIKKPALVRDWLHEARVRGLLSKARAGKREGYMLPAGLTLLRAAKKSNAMKGRRR